MVEELKDVTEVIDNIDKALSCYQFASVTVENYDTLIQALYRISWRSSEISSKKRFGKKAIFKDYIDERTWIILDYLSNALVKLVNPEFSATQNQTHIVNYLNGIKTDLESLKKALHCREKANIEQLREFVSPLYDQYLLYKVSKEINTISKNIKEDIIGDNKYHEFLTEKQNMYGLFHVLEIIGECFKNWSSNTLKNFFSNNTGLSFTQLRNDIEHARLRLEIIVKYNKDIFKPILDITLELGQHIQNVILPCLDTLSTSSADDFALSFKRLFTSFNLSGIKNVRSTLKKSPLIPRKLAEDILESIDPQDKEAIARILYKLDNTPINSVDEFKKHLINFKLNGDPNIRDKINGILDSFMKESYSKVTEITVFRQKLIDKINKNKCKDLYSASSCESSKRFTVDHSQVTLIEGSTCCGRNLASSQGSNPLSSFSEASATKKIRGNVEKSYNIKHILSELVRKKFISDPEKKIEAVVDALLIPKDTFDNLSKIIEGLKPNFPEIFQRLESNLTIEALFEGFQEIAKEDELKKHLNIIKKVCLRKLLQNKSDPTCQTHVSFIEQQIPVEEKNVDEEIDTSKSNTEKMFSLIRRTEYLIKELEQTFIEHRNISTEEKRKDLLKLSAQYILEDIGNTLGGLIKYKEFKDYGYLSISKRQFFILNTARKAMAHHTLQLHEQMLEFYVDQLVLDSMLRLHDLNDKLLIIMGDEIVDFIPRRSIPYEELEQRKEEIKSIIMGNGFSGEFKGFSKKLGCDVGVQGDFVFVVFPMEGRATNPFELELELSYSLKSDIKVYTVDTLRSDRKITLQHIKEVLDVEEFDDFLTTKKFEQIYNDKPWIKAKILGLGDVKKGQQPISKEQFATATEVEYVFGQQYKNARRTEMKLFRQDRIENIKEIEDIIRDKANKYAQKICEVLNEIKEKVGLHNLDKLFDVLMLDRSLIHKAEEYFIEHEYEIKAKFPELSTTTKSAFVNYVYDKSEVIVTKFLELVNCKELRENKESQYNSLDCSMKEAYDKLGFSVTLIMGIEIIEDIRTATVVENNDLLKLQQAIFINLKEKYCDDTDILLIWLKKNLCKSIPDFVMLDFSGEVERVYLQEKEEMKKQLLLRGIGTINQILSGGLPVLEILANTNHLSTGDQYTYKRPHVSNGILGFGSELDPDLEHIYEQILRGNVRCKSLEPNFLYVEHFIDKASVLLQNGNMIERLPKIDTTYRFKAQVNLHEAPTSSFNSTDAKKVEDYCNFRHMYDGLNMVLCRADKHIHKARNFQDLISKNRNIHTKQLQQEKLKKIKDVLQQDYEKYTSGIKEICNTSYVKERIIKILQNPFELLRILAFVQKQNVSEEEQENLFKSIINNAISTIKSDIKQELANESMLKLAIDSMLTLKHLEQTLNIFADDQHFHDFIKDLTIV